MKRKPKTPKVKEHWVEIIDPAEIAAITSVHYRDWHPTWQRKEGNRIYARVDEIFKAWRAKRATFNTGVNANGD